MNVGPYPTFAQAFADLLDVATSRKTFAYSEEKGAHLVAALTGNVASETV